MNILSPLYCRRPSTTLLVRVGVVVKELNFHPPFNIMVLGQSFTGKFDHINYDVLLSQVHEFRKMALSDWLHSTFNYLILQNDVILCFMPYTYVMYWHIEHQFVMKNPIALLLLKQVNESIFIQTPRKKKKKGKIKSSHWNKKRKLIHIHPNLLKAIRK